MPSPFPGMNPYLEQDRVWNDFHGSFMPAARAAVAAQVRPHFIAKINEHLFVRLPAVDRERLSFLEIRDRDGWQLVTVIELLSPTNKYSGPDREQYLARRRDLLASAVHFVEIDLLRGGPRMPMEDLPECDYCVLVSRVETRPRPGCGRSASAPHCRRCRSRSGHRTPMRSSTCKGCCTAFTTPPGTRTTSTAASRTPS